MLQQRCVKRRQLNRERSQTYRRNGSLSSFETRSCSIHRVQAPPALRTPVHPTSMQVHATAVRCSPWWNQRQASIIGSFWLFRCNEWIIVLKHVSFANVYKFRSILLKKCTFSSGREVHIVETWVDLIVFHPAVRFYRLESFFRLVVFMVGNVY